MLFLLAESPEFPDVDSSVRYKAAMEARQCSIRQLKFWKGFGAIPASVILGAILDLHTLHSKDGTVGAMLGFFAGGYYYGRCLYEVGMPHYRRIMKEKMQSGSA